MRRLGIMLIVVVAMVAFGCGHGHDHPHEEGGHAPGKASGHGEGPGHPHGEAHGHEDAHGDEHGDAHGHGHDGASEVVTRWGEATQLFVEFPALVVGEDSPFAAHLTRLSDHFAIDRGQVVVELSGDDQPVERFAVESPTQPGIFRPIVRPTHPGRRTVTLRLDSPATSERHAVGRFTVYATRAEADADADDDDAPADAISYLLEQQWKVPFRVVWVAARPMRPSIAAFARLTPPSDADAIIRAPADGRLRAGGGAVRGGRRRRGERRGALRALGRASGRGPIRRRLIWRWSRRAFNSRRPGAMWIGSRRSSSRARCRGGGSTRRARWWQRRRPSSAARGGASRASVRASASRARATR